MYIIDLSSEWGSTTRLISVARKLAKQLSIDEEETEAIIEEMLEGSYNELLDAFESYFGEIALLQNRPFELDEGIWGDEVEDEEHTWNNYDY